MDSSNAPVIAFDFDGVIASTNGFIDHDHEPEPTPETVRAITLLREKGCKVLIHSTRGDEFLKMYCEKFAVPYDYINRRPDIEGKNTGKPIAFVYIDDRALNYHGQTAEELLAEIERFKTHWM